MLEALQTALNNHPEQMDDEGSNSAHDSHQASEFIYAGVGESQSIEKKKHIDINWFEIIRNPGGGDCLLHALKGRAISFEEVCTFRELLAQAAENVVGPTISGSMIYQSLYQSGFLSSSMESAICGKHQVPREIYQRAIRVPGLYAGEEEIQIFCSMHDTPDQVFIVTDQGELRQVTAKGMGRNTTIQLTNEAQFKQMIRDLLNKNEIVLFKSFNHWVKITGVKDE